LIAFWAVENGRAGEKCWPMIVGGYKGWGCWVIGQLALNRDGCELGATVEVVTFDPQCSRGLICPTVAFKCQLVLLLWFQFLPHPSVFYLSGSFGPFCQPQPLPHTNPNPPGSI